MTPTTLGIHGYTIAVIDVKVDEYSISTAVLRNTVLITSPELEVSLAFSAL